ncbi:outer membrane lipid asymmetry maintenance protein MlaD [Telmatospirillum sp. J64-1]|uniref:outer membrane lipid asymmetry maintenance protein MlaD n=1 Tax=Telmatospirillum sp. J64-1 TaxID=2502183 RepID=UPI00115ED03F|nr:outer membrane lipid asymmetry maintenance protein MlaD [Telmatospirillum sp. J64-1]
MARNSEAIIGAVVLAAGAFLLWAVFTTGQLFGGGNDGYHVTARFNRTDGLVRGSEVRLAGMEVGRVVGERLDDRFRAILTLRLAPGIELPRDTAAAIHTDGLLGSKFIELQPGGDEENIPPGGEIFYTQDAVVLQDLLEMIVAEARARRGMDSEEETAPEGAGQ